MSDEVVWTSRRALLRAAGNGWTPGRVRVSDRTLRFTALDGTVVEVPHADLAGIRLAGRPRRVLVLETPDGPLRLRCFALPAIATLLDAARIRTDSRLAAATSPPNGVSPDRS